MSEREITIEIKSPEVLITIITLLIFFFLDLQVMFNNPVVFGDEGYHGRVAQLIAKNVEYPVWEPVHYTKLEKNAFARQPFLHFVIGSFLFIFGGYEGLIRFLIPFMAFLTGLAVFILGKELYNKKVGFIASIISVTIPAFVTYSVLVYTDVLVTLFMVMFFLLFVLYSKKNNKIYLVASGIFGALAFLTKVSGFGSFIFVFFVFIYYLITKRQFKIFKDYFILFIILILISSTFFIRNFYYFGTPICGFPIFSEFLSTEGCRIDNFESKYNFEGRGPDVGTEQSLYKMGIMNYLNFAYGYIPIFGFLGNFVILGLFAGLFILLSNRGKNDIFILLILLIFLIVFIYVAFGRAEDTARFTLAWSPFIAIVSAKWFEEVYNFIKRYQRYLALVIFIFVIVLSYQNLKDKLDVMAKVKQFSPSFFEACDWVKENLPENVTLTLIWGHRAVYNCERNAVGHSADIFLSRDINYTKEVAEKLGITHIFIQKFGLSFDKAYSEQYKVDSLQFFEEHPETFKKVYENGPPLQQCIQQGGCDGNIIYEIVL